MPQSLRKSHKGTGLLSVLALIALFLLPVLQAQAVNPDEMLKDPALEARAREISAELRCLVCQNQSIDDSDAPLAKDLRVLVRERIKQGDTNEQAMDFLVSRYGEFVLLKPTFTGKNLILWLFGPLILVFGLFAVHQLYRKNRNRAAAQDATGRVTLSDEEHARLKKILSEESDV